MDLSTILVGSILILVSVLPLVILNRTRKSKEKKKLLVLSNTAKQHGGSLTDYEFGANWSLGLDDNDWLIFVLHEQISAFHLAEIQHCKTSFSYANNKSAVIDEVRLTLESADKQKPLQTIALYNSERDERALADELRQSEKWQKIIAQRINEIKKRKKSK